VSTAGDNDLRVPEGTAAASVSVLDNRPLAAGGVIPEPGKAVLQPFPGMTTRRFHKWLLPLLMEWLVIVGMMAIGFQVQSYLLWPVIVVLVGSRQHALGVLGHDGAHFTAANNRKVNDITTAVGCFWPLMTTLADFRRFHFNHHRYFQTERDPELIFKHGMSPRQWRTPISRTRIYLYFLGDLVGFGILEIWKARKVLSMNDAPQPRDAWRWLGPAAWLAVMIPLLYSTGYLAALGIWFLSLITSFWGFFRLRTWTEHGGTSSTHLIRLTWWQKLLITPHGSWSHYEHHEISSIPFWSRHQVCAEGSRTQTLGELLGSFGSVES
jgi:fatty acid desaturase